jgi:hypothetical protein
MAFIEEEGRESGESVIVDNAEPWIYSSCPEVPYFGIRRSAAICIMAAKLQAYVITPVSLRAYATQSLICEEDFEV